MTHDEFEIFFDKCFQKIPDGDRSEILAYWNSWKVSRVIVTDDDVISQQRKIQKAAVTGVSCFHIFLFRNYISSFAPDTVQETIIKHELAHCMLNSSKKYVEKPMDLRKFPYHEGRVPSSDWGRKIQRAEEQGWKMWADEREEVQVSALNKKWGSDEVAAHRWCDDYIRQNQVK